jgi:hypothetical protein
MPSYGGSNLGGGPFNGFSARQTITNYKSSEDALTRRVLRNGWNTQYATGKFGSYNRITTPFRAVNNSGDFLSREHYSCGGPNPAHSNVPGNSRGIGSMFRNCDATGVPASSCNVKFVADSSDYTTFKKQRASNYTYNDLKNGGDQSNGSYVSLMAVRRR